MWPSDLASASGTDRGARATGREARRGRMPMPTRRDLRRADVPLTLALAFAVIAAVMPLLRVVAPGGWMAAALALGLAILATSLVLRRVGAPAAVVSLAEALVWVGLVTLMFFADTAVLGVIPTPATFEDLPALAGSASEQIVLGVAPLQAERGLSALIAAALGALVVLLDHTVITARMPLLAGVALVAVWLVPALAVPSRVDLVGFVVLAAALLLLIRTETRSRERALQRGAAAARPPSARVDAAPGRSGTGAVVAAGIAVVAIVATVVITPELPRPTARIGVGTGPATTINANLELGDDLRRPSEVEVLTVRTNATTTPYLRAATLSQFDGEVWEPDRDGAVPLTPEAFGPVAADPSVRVTEYATIVDITQLTSGWLPTPGPAVRIDGLSGQWNALPAGRTVIAEQADTQGQEYTTTTHVVRPTLEQIQAAEADADALGDGADLVTALPDDMPPVIAETAAEISAGATNDYDRLVELQRWFRSSEFVYSLDAPVDDGFDGSGADAVADFLEVRAGYCVHFASAFALMARSLDMPARIVVGYLPGTPTGEVDDGQAVAAVSSSQLHAWPEVHFAGIGWVPFEPTNSLGAPPTYPRETQPVPSDGGEDVTPAPQPEPSASAAPGQTPTPTPTSASRPGEQDGLAVLGATAGYLGLGLAVLLVILAPAAAGFVRRRVLAAAANRGRVVAAWSIVRDTALDLGVDVTRADSPRSLAARLETRPGVPLDRLTSLVTAVERAGYGRPASRGERRGTATATDRGREAVADARAVRRGLLAGASASTRSSAVLLPRSLFAALGGVIQN